MKIITVIVLLTIKTNHCDTDYKEASKSKNPLPYFRRHVEEVQSDSTVEPFTEDSNRNLVSFLVKNVKEIFDDIAEGDNFGLIPTRTTPVYFATITPVLQGTTVDLHDVMLFENLSLTTLLDHNLIEPLVVKDDIENTLKSELMQLTKEMKSHEKSDLAGNDVNAITSISSYVLDTTELIDLKDDNSDPKRSCIFCNNVVSENCNDPQNKLIPTIMCGRDGDLCYSRHTPFGVIDRGCFNINQNLTTYVCTCNLCNYISISEMPYIFSNKQDWVDNVIELSRTRNFRKSVFKDMSCLRCEVNTTTKMGDLLDSANCLEGNIGNLPTQVCDKNEVCAVKAVRSDGYIWRGCVQAPLYNYWWALCDTDLCNHDVLVSIYDYLS